MSVDHLTLALSKGRLCDQMIDLLERAGYDCTQLRHPGRALVLKGDQLTFLLVKPADVPTYVERGAADIGIVGKDTLMEENKSLYEMLDLGFGRCQLCIAGTPGVRTQGYMRIATKYPGIARQIFSARGQNIEIIKLHGSVELGPLVGLSDVILDIVESGNTLRANGLDVLETICELSARLVVNRVALKTKRTAVARLIDAISHQLETNDLE